MGRKAWNLEQDKNGSSSARGTWTKQREFVLTSLGYAVGLGNVWRFPYLCYENGGGAFLIPYAVMLALVGIPVFLMEILMAQYSGKGALHVWDCAPFFKGTGIGMLVFGGIACISYTIILAYCFYYFFVSFYNPLPWDSCQHNFNSDFCYNKREAMPCEEQLNGTWFNGTCYNASYLSQFEETREYCNTTGCHDYTYNPKAELLANLTRNLRSSSVEYYQLQVLKISGGIEDTGGIVWHLAVALLVSWFVCYLCVMRGTKSIGKAVYFTVFFPYLILIALLIYASLLPGSLEGIKFYIIPDWEKLKSAKVWGDAAGQIFFTLSLGGGGLTTIASYNKFHNNVFRDTLVVCITNCVTSFVAGFVIFATLGYMAHELNTEVDQVVVEGSMLVFVAYPTALASLPVPQLWSVLFFLMLITLTLDSLFAAIETDITGILDTFPRLRRLKWLVALAVCATIYVLGLTTTTRAGIYWLVLLNYYGVWSLLVLGIVETVAFAWVYGAKKMLAHVREMCGFDIGVHWLAIWYVITPGVLIATLVFTIVDLEPLTFGPYQYPPWATAVGWMLALGAPAFLVMVAIGETIRVCCFQSTSSCTLQVSKLFRPNANWGPNYSSGSLDGLGHKTSTTRRSRSLQTVYNIQPLGVEPVTTLKYQASNRDHVTDATAPPQNPPGYPQSDYTTFNPLYSTNLLY